MEWLIKFGYLAVFLGSMIEGESVILTAGVLAYQGYFSLWKLILVSFIGTLVADQGLFHLGRVHGHKVLKRWPKFASHSDRALRLLHRYNTLFIISFRFIYGIRIISPVIIGMSGVSTKRFTILNLVAAAIWSSASCVAGYMLGRFGVEAWEKVKAVGGQYYWLIPLACVLLLMGLWLARRLKRRKG